MKTAIIIILLLGLLDTFLIIACSRFEKDRTLEDEEQMKWIEEWGERREP